LFGLVVLGRIDALPDLGELNPLLFIKLVFAFALHADEPNQTKPTNQKQQSIGVCCFGIEVVGIGEGTE